jgi:Family of unknown function (DUF6529)
MAYHPYFAPDPARAPAAAEPAPPRPRAAKLLLPALAGAVMAVGLGVYGRDHKAGGQITFDLGFSGIFPMKTWLALAAGAVALLQLLSALWMYGKLPGRAPSWVGGVHRVFGTVAFLLTLPVAYACLYALGFDDASPRVLAHSVLGCAFYGAFVTKLLVLRTSRLPGWALPVVGGLLFTALVGVVLTSAVYTVAKTGSPGF